MRERPILFSGPMVRAILNGTKTQTRRVVKWRHPSPGLNHSFTGLSVYSYTPTTFTLESQGERRSQPTQCPYGQVGDRLWVRETWQHTDFPEGPYIEGIPVYYRADYLHDPHGPDGELSSEGKYRSWKPSIHMPKSAARIWLEITNVRVERLMRISDADALAEGVDRTNTSITGYATERFKRLWETINGTGSWDTNPFVWVVEFKRIPAPTTDATTHPA